jgi:hypothetical protein
VSQHSRLLCAPSRDSITETAKTIAVASGLSRFSRVFWFKTLRGSLQTGVGNERALHRPWPFALTAPLRSTPKAAPPLLAQQPSHPAEDPRRTAASASQSASKSPAAALTQCTHQKGDASNLNGLCNRQKIVSVRFGWPNPSAQTECSRSKQRSFALAARTFATG